MGIEVWAPHTWLHLHRSPFQWRCRGTYEHALWLLPPTPFLLLTVVKYCFLLCLFCSTPIMPTGHESSSTGLFMGSQSNAPVNAILHMPVQQLYGQRSRCSARHRLELGGHSAHCTIKHDKSPTAKYCIENLNHTTIHVSHAQHILDSNTLQCRYC